MEMQVYHRKAQITDYGTDLKDIAKFILGNCSMGCVSEFDKETHLNFIVKDLEKAGEYLLYYLSDATENGLIQKNI